ncbi:hypothetical protein ACLOJK_000762 [Asimina triloba]
MLGIRITLQVIRAGDSPHHSFHLQNVCQQQRRRGREGGEREMEIELSSGFKMPVMGLGVWRMEGKSITDVLINAIKIGYRHFDCAGKILSLPYTSSLKPSNLYPSKPILVEVASYLMAEIEIFGVTTSR